MPKCLLIIDSNDPVTELGSRDMVINLIGKLYSYVDNLKENDPNVLRYRRIVTKLAYSFRDETIGLNEDVTINGKNLITLQKKGHPLTKEDAVPLLESIYTANKSKIDEKEQSK